MTWKSREKWNRLVLQLEYALKIFYKKEYVQLDKEMSQKLAASFFSLSFQ